MLDTVDAFMNGFLNKLILWILAASGVVLVADAVGFLPEWIQTWVNRNRLRETLRLLGNMGMDIPAARRDNIVGKLEKNNSPDPEARVKSRLNTTKINHEVSIGSRNRMPGAHFYDLMGASTDQGVAEVFARDIAALWGRLVGSNIVTATDIAFIVTPKAGAPILGAAVAQALGLPLLLHNSTHKFSSDPADARAIFDCLTLPEAGVRGLIVDDSSTGGSKAIKLVDDVRAQGWAVSDFLVVFEPMLKEPTRENAATRLATKGVTLHSILRT